MAITKKFLKTKPVCKVKFELPKDEVENGESVFLVGDFNNWDTSTTPMKKLKSGKYTVTVDLATNQDYQFRYLVGHENWLNDTDADSYEPSPYADTDNSVVSV
ncbi:isoamylase early set domain-containing protein [Maridesulfovibrio bastinii]|uniref:isoamylase early set domain-containing protein n=1 Tax=Maridesulfovibrio bastinii TaxID=47157 RepID=UPI000421C4F5|nr:isoamylase early set domain-containing protein [Maridesulfovibrio bastinii]